MTNDNYNDWTNYATWRVNMECVDSVNYEHDECGRSFDTVQDLANSIRDNVELFISDEASGGNGTDSRAYEYAMAFLSDVNWYEIAEARARDNDKVIIMEDVPF